MIRNLSAAFAIVKMYIWHMYVKIRPWHGTSGRSGAPEVPRIRASNRFAHAYHSAQFGESRFKPQAALTLRRSEMEASDVWTVGARLVDGPGELRGAAAISQPRGFSGDFRRDFPA